MRIRDKIITAACLTKEGLEWTSLKVNQDGAEPFDQARESFAVPEEVQGQAFESNVQLLDGIGSKLQGDITAAIRTAELLMRTMEFPTSDPAEIASMVGFQIDKFSPFPLDQLAVAHEILKETENGALVLMVAAKRDCIDAIGDTFGQKGIHIHSIDARILGWLHLLENGKHLSRSGCELIIFDDGIDFALAVLHDGQPLAFRSLQGHLADKSMADDLAEEINYTLTTLDADYDLPAPKSIDFWCIEEPSAPIMGELRLKSGLAVHMCDLGTLPPLSEGIIERARNKDNRIELIPHEWIEHKKNEQLKKKFIVLTSSIVATWLLVMVALFSVFQARAIVLSRVQKKADAIAPKANQALENRRKLRKLSNYADRSDSALECLREVTRLLPPTDIDFASFNYSKEKGVTLRGTADSEDAVYDFFEALSKSKLFTELKNQSVNQRVTRGERRAVYSITLLLPIEEEEQE